MNKKQYDVYVKRFNEFMDNEDINCLNQQDNDDSYHAFFSWESCDVCGTRSGSRYICNGYNPTTRQIQYDYCVCQDCVYFAEYGRLDDMTMLEIEDSE